MSNKSLNEVIDSIFGTGYAQLGAAQAQIASKAAANASKTAAMMAQNQAAQQAAFAAQKQAQNLGVFGVSGMPSHNWNVSGVSGSYGTYVDPLVYATQTAMKQPSDKKWRRFQNALFKLEDVEGVTAEGSGSISLRLRSPQGYGIVFTLPFDCEDQVQWFAEHVLQMEFPNNRPT